MELNAFKIQENIANLLLPLIVKKFGKIILSEINFDNASINISSFFTQITI